MKSEQEQIAHSRFLQALQHEHLTCARPGCGGAMDVADHTPHNGRIKTYEAKCERCHVTETITGVEQTSPGMSPQSP
jgi:C4-type Zn-finger protein